MKYLPILLLALFFSSCVTQEKCNKKFPCYNRIDTIINNEIDRDTVVQFMQDQALVEAYIKCDSLGNVYIDSIGKIKQGERIIIKWKLKDNVIYTDCTIDSQSVYIKWKERYVKESVVVTEKAEDTKFQHTLKLLLWLVGFIVGAYVVSVVYRLFRS